MSEPMPPSQPLTPQQRIHMLLAEIPADELRAFEAYYQRHLAVALRRADDALAGTPVGAADPDQVEQAVIAGLVREAEGRDRPDGLGVVPTDTLIYDILPPERDPRLLPARGRSAHNGRAAPEMNHTRSLAAVLIVLGGILATAWSLIASARSGVDGGTPPPAAAVAATTTPAPNATPTPFAETAAGGAEVLEPTSLEIAGANGAVYRVVPSVGELGGIWTPLLERGTAAWLQDTFVNPVICLPSDAAPLARTLPRGERVLIRTANGALRQYEVARVRTAGRQQIEVLDQRRAGLTLVVCGDRGNQRTVVEAIFRPEAPDAPPQPSGTTASLADLLRVRVEAVRVLTPTADFAPGLAHAEIEASVTNLADGDLPWDTVVDQLELGGSVAPGTPRLPRLPLPANTRQVVRWDYLVPSAGGPAIWRLTALDGESVAIALTLPPAPDAAARGMDISFGSADVRVDGSSAPSRLHLTIHLRTQRAEPVVVDAADVQVWAGATSLPLREPTTRLPVVVHADTPADLVLAVDYPQETTTLVVQLGQRRWRVQLPPLVDGEGR